MNKHLALTPNRYIELNESMNDQFFGDENAF